MLDWQLAVSRKTVAGLFFCFFIFLSGCSNVAVQNSLRTPGTSPDSTLVYDVPFYPQDVFQCGPASLAMVLSWSGLPVNPKELSPQVYLPDRKGSLQSAIIAGARRHGRIAYPFTGAEQLMAEVGAGRPVIVLLNLSLPWFPKWHYAVVIGYDRQTETIILHSGNQPEENLSFRLFSNIWGRSGCWALTVLPPHLMPVAPDETKWLEAITGLERTEKWKEALTAYEKASHRWPANPNFLIGMGNCRYSLKDYTGAAEAFKKAVRVQPDSGIAYNNLAQSLLMVGQYEDAEMIAKKAVELGGPLQEKFRQTLDEILEISGKNK